MNNIPNNLNPIYDDLLSYPENKKKELVENIRTFLLERWEKYNIPPTETYDDGELCKIFNDLLRKTRQGINGDIINYPSLNSMKAINQFFPHMLRTSSGKAISSLEALQDSKFFYRMFELKIFNEDMNNKLALCERGKPIFPNIFTLLRKTSGIQYIANFNPYVAKDLYRWAWKKYEEINNQKIDYVKIFDPCMGWGGRLIGFLSLQEVDGEYCGVDVSKQTVSGLTNLHNFWSKNIGINNILFGYNKKVTLNNVAIEDYLPSTQYHISFTSPPYFNTELYPKLENEKQSYLNDTYDKWRDNFLYNFIKKNHELLLTNGLFMLNIADVKINKKIIHPLEDDSIKIAEQMGFELIHTFKMIMTMGLSLNKEKIKNYINIEGEYYKYEPIFIFKKIN